MSPAQRRGCLAAAAASLLLVAGLRNRVAGQAAISLSRPSQEHLTFWTHHGGLEQIEVEGEVGFGDMARILLRRRTNAPLIRPLRDRFTFRVRDIGSLRTPDVFRVRLTETGLEWEQAPDQLIAAAGRTYNLPLIVDNATSVEARVSARWRGPSSESRFDAVAVAPHAAAGFFLRLNESRPGAGSGALAIEAGVNRTERRVPFEVRPLASLRVKLRDSDGSPVAARVYLTGADGLAYATRGAVSRITAMSAEYYFHAEDAFSIDLPAGDTRIEAARGPEYEPVAERAHLEPGRPAEVTLRLRRWTHMAARHWYSADAHIHANYTHPSHQTMTPEDMRLQARAEDLNVSNLMVANSSGAYLHDWQYFEGKAHRLSAGNYILYWNEEMRNAGLYGHMAFFRLKELVHPLYTGFRDTPHWEDYPPNYTLAMAARRQGAAVTYVHPGQTPGAGMEGASCRALPVDAALGAVDAVDVVSNASEQFATELWYRLLNCGLRLAISAGTDSFTNVADHYTLGGGRVWVHTAKPLDYDDWVENYRRGRSFAGNGPILLLTVDGKEPGEQLHYSESRRRLHVSVQLDTKVPIERVEVLANGRTVLKSAGGNIDGDIILESSAWIAARAIGPWSRMVLNDAEAFAHTSPVYVYLGGKPIHSPEDARYFIDWIERLEQWVKQRGKFASAEKRQQVIDLLQSSLAFYRKQAR